MPALAPVAIGNSQGASAERRSVCYSAPHYGDDLANLVHVDLSLAAANHLGDVTAPLELGLRPHLIANAQSIKQLVEVNAT